jgi:hypothetical protein
MSFIPEGFAYNAAISLLMNTSTFQYVLPELEKEAGLNKPLDFRCGFS